MGARKRRTRGPSRWLALGLTVLILTLARAGSADTVDAVYSDIRDVLSQLIQRRASEDTAAFVRRSSAGLGFYLNRSLENVRRGQWGALHDSLRDDFADLAGDYTWWELRYIEQHDELQKRGAAANTRSTLTGRQERAAMFQAFLDCFDMPTPRESAATKAACRTLRFLAREPHSLHQRTLVSHECRAQVPAPKFGNEFSCDVAELVRAAFLDDAAEAQLRAQRLLAAAGSFLLPEFAHPGVPGRVGEPLRGLLEATLAFDPTSEKPPAPWPLVVGPDRQLANALRSCRSRPPAAAIRAAAVDGAAVLKDPAEATLGVGAVCLNGTDVGSLPIMVALEPPAKGPVEYQFEQLLAALQRGLPPQQALFDALGEHGDAAKLTVLGFTCLPDQTECTRAKDGKVEKVEVQQLALALLALSNLQGRVFERDPTHDAIACVGQCPFRVLQLAAEFGALRGLPEGAGRSLRDVASQMEHGLSLIVQYGDAWKSNWKGSVLSRVRLLVPRNDASPYVDLEEIVRASLQGDRAELATFALRSTFDDLFQPYGPTKFDALFADLVINMTQFMLEESDQDSASVAREALHASGIRLLDGLASQQGFTRQGITLRPVATLRASWNQGYRNARGSNGLRYVPSLDWPAVRMRLSEATAAQFTLFDLLAPLAEIASREQLKDDAAYHQQSLILLDALRPRLNLLVGFPALSRNLVGSVGLGFRLITPVPMTKEDAGSREYRTTVEFQQQLSDALEVNLGGAYVF